MSKKVKKKVKKKSAVKSHSAEAAKAMRDEQKRPRGLGAGTKPSVVLVKKATKFKDLKNKAEELDKKLKLVKTDQRAAMFDLVKEMVNGGFSFIRLAKLGGFRVQTIVYPNVIDRNKLEKHLEKNPKLKFLYSTNIHGGKLKSYMKELMEDGKKTPPGVDPFTLDEIRTCK